MEGFAYNDPNSEMAKSLRTAPNGVGLLRFRQDDAPGLRDLPKLTASMVRVRSKPTKAVAVSFSVTPERIEVSKSLGNEKSAIGFEKQQAVRIDRTGRFFFIVEGESGAPFCLMATPWIAPALALLMAGASRRGALRELEIDIDRKVRNL